MGSLGEKVGGCVFKMPPSGLFQKVACLFVFTVVFYYLVVVVYVCVFTCHDSCVEDNDNLCESALCVGSGLGRKYPCLQSYPAGPNNACL